MISVMGNGKVTRSLMLEVNIEMSWFRMLGVFRVKASDVTCGLEKEKRRVLS